MLDKKFYISVAATILLYVILIKLDEKKEYYDKTSAMYAAGAGVLMFFGMRALESNAVDSGKPVVGENVMTTPFNQ
jgi:hypothetical protein